jgi:hypothetical protein
VAVLAGSSMISISGACLPRKARTDSTVMPSY